MTVESLDKQREVIRDAFQSQFVVTNGGAEAVADNSGWIAEVFEDYVIAEFGSDYFKIYYSQSGDEITFVDNHLWIPVEEKREWIEEVKSLKTQSLRAFKTISKTQDELRVGNYMALFGGSDIEGEHFTKTTDFESVFTRQGKFDINWEHGLGQRLDGEDSPGPNEVLGYVDWKTAVVDRMGLWVERVLDR